MAQQNRLIFLVDDDPMQVQMLKDYLGDKYVLDLKVFETGEAAIEQLSLNPEMIILDYHLMSANKTAENGIEILKKIKSILPTTHVIMLSGQDKIQVAVECMKYGAFDYVTKSESAFVRIENLMNNLGEKIRNEQLLKLYKKGLMISISIIGLIVIGAIVIVKMGWAEAKFVVF
jgi:two-component system OmpR family response regulator